MKNKNNNSLEEHSLFNKYHFYMHHKDVCLPPLDGNLNKKIKQGKVEEEYYMSINILNDIWNSLSWLKRIDLAKFLNRKIYSPHLADLEDYERRSKSNLFMARRKK